MNNVFENILRSGMASLTTPYCGDFNSELPYSLPKSHRELLELSNGVSVYHGYVKLFGIKLPGRRDLVSWNALDTWKFAWPEDLSRFLCFAESGIGNQYAYDIAELQNTEHPKVYHLSHIDMSAEVWEESFDKFASGELLRWCIDPYDDRAVKLIQMLGALGDNEQFAYTPPKVVGGPDLAQNGMKIDATTNMIIGGDLYSQMVERDSCESVAGLEPTIDSKGRTRIKIRWGPEADDRHSRIIT